MGGAVGVFQGHLPPGYGLAVQGVAVSWTDPAHWRESSTSWSEGSTSTWAPSGSLPPLSDTGSMDEDGMSSISSAGGRETLRPMIFVRATYRYLSMEVEERRRR